MTQLLMANCIILLIQHDVENEQQLKKFIHGSRVSKIAMVIYDLQVYGSDTKAVTCLLQTLR